MKAGEFFVELRLRKDKFDKGLADSKKSLKMFALEALASVYLLDRFAEKSTNAATKLTNLARVSGVAAQKLKQYGLASTLLNAGISAEEASNQLAEFSKNLYNIQRFGEGDFGGFNKLQSIGKGISYYGKDAVSVLEEIRSKIVGLSDQEATNVLGSFGFSPEMLPMFRATTEEINNINKALGRTDNEIANLEKIDRVINSIKVNWSFLQDSIVLSLSPALESLAESLKNIKDKGLLNAVKSGIKDKYQRMIDYGKESKYYNDMRKELERLGKRPEEIESIISGLKGRNSKSSSPAGKNNWGNIRGADGRFKGFSTPQEGMNALVADIRAKISGKSAAMASKYGPGYVPTLESLISTYAPPHENNTRGYIDFMHKQTGIDPNRPLSGADIESVVKAIAKMEGNKNITLNNTNHIHGSDGQATAGMIGDELARTLKHALADQNNGAF